MYFCLTIEHSLSCFFQYFHSLGAVISIIAEDNRLLDGSIGKLTLLPIVNVSAISKLLAPNRTLSPNSLLTPVYNLEGMSSVLPEMPRNGKFSLSL